MKRFAPSTPGSWLTKSLYKRPLPVNHVKTPRYACLKSLGSHSNKPGLAAAPPTIWILSQLPDHKSRPQISRSRTIARRGSCARTSSAAASRLSNSIAVSRFPTAPTGLGNPSGIPTLPRPGYCLLITKQKPAEVSPINRLPACLSFGVQSISDTLSRCPH
jgi:hypothetical protein